MASRSSRPSTKKLLDFKNEVSAGAAEERANMGKADDSKEHSQVGNLSGKHALTIQEEYGEHFAVRRKQI